MACPTSTIFIGTAGLVRLALRVATRRGLKPVIVETKNLSKKFKVGEHSKEILHNINLKIYSEDFVIIYGPSGCGKTTLLNIIIGLEKPTDGEVLVKSTNIYKLDEDSRSSFRADKFGIVYQQAYWIKSFDVLDNVALPLVIEGYERNDALEKAKTILAELKMSEYANHLPVQLSGGQQQVIGLARSLVSDPSIIITDEPTGNLDYKSGLKIMDLLSGLNKYAKRTIILVTHNKDYLEKYGSRRISMLDGRIVN